MQGRGVEFSSVFSELRANFALVNKGEFNPYKALGVPAGEDLRISPVCEAAEEFVVVSLTKPETIQIQTVNAWVQGRGIVSVGAWQKKLGEPSWMVVGDDMFGHTGLDTKSHSEYLDHLKIPQEQLSQCQLVLARPLAVVIPQTRFLIDSSKRSGQVSLVNYFKVGYMSNYFLLGIFVVDRLAYKCQVGLESIERWYTTSMQVYRKFLPDEMAEARRNLEEIRGKWSGSITSVG